MGGWASHCSLEFPLNLGNFNDLFFGVFEPAKISGEIPIHVGFCVNSSILFFARFFFVILIGLSSF